MAKVLAMDIVIPFMEGYRPGSLIRRVIAAYSVMLNPSASLRINEVKQLAGRYSPVPDSSLTLRMTCTADFYDIILAEGAALCLAAPPA